MDSPPADRKAFYREWLRKSRTPFSLFFVTAAIAFFCPLLITSPTKLEPFAICIAGLLLVLAASFGAWGLFCFIDVLESRLLVAARHSSTRFDDFLYPFAGVLLRGAIPLVMLFCILGPITFPERFLDWAAKLPPLVAIFSLGWILYRTSTLGERVILEGVTSSPQLESRGMVTRIRLLRRLAVVAIGFFTVSTALMLFEPVRHLGTSLLASAGVLGIVLGLAAQRTFGNLFAGIQIAFSQPIRIGDQLKLENEVGFVEEITLTYVVVRLWDLRRLMLPISYFIENPFQNWTRTSTNIIGTVMLYVDFTAPVPILRERFRAIVEASKHWNQNTCALHVTSCDDVCMQLRLIASAPTAGDSFELQCEIREKMLDCLRREYPQSLPRARNEQKSVEIWDKAINQTLN